MHHTLSQEDKENLEIRVFLPCMRFMKKIVFCNVALLSMLKLGPTVVTKVLTFEHCQIR
jgi:hypothetical protein